VQQFVWDAKKKKRRVLEVSSSVDPAEGHLEESGVAREVAVIRLKPPAEEVLDKKRARRLMRSRGEAPIWDVGGIPWVDTRAW